MSETNNIDGMNAFQRALKRMGDILGAAVLLALFLPFFILLIIIYKVTGGGPAFYTQERIGLHGKPFQIYKFRTMVVNAEKEDVPVLEQPDDVRLLKYGKFMRSHHIDELPQLLNVLRGDMSFVGYRPERRYFIDKIMEVNRDYELLFVSRPGVTSLATIRNGYTDTLDKMLRRLDYDLDYLRHRSLLLDWKIIFETVFSI
ncbi:MAG: sugar transferase [Bacteroidaceae bacterium]|nr:sugar transferase [Bacteroidaceae bacterium]